MVNGSGRIVKFNELDIYGKVNCMDQFMNILCPYEDFRGMTIEEMGANVDYWVEECPEQFWFDTDGNWYDEGRMVR